MAVTHCTKGFKMSKDKDKDSLRWAAHSYPPAYPGCHGLHPQALSRDTLNSVCSSPNDYG